MILSRHNNNRKIIRPLIILLFFSITSYAGKPPKDIEEAVAYFEKRWSKKDKKKFSDKPEKRAVLDAHFGVGMWIRNEWIRGNRDTLLINHFNSLGIYHPDDMSSIILTSLHRKLNNKPLDIEGQVKYYIEYWRPINACEVKAKQEALAHYKRLNVNDSVEIHMYVNDGDNYRNAVNFSCPKTNNREFNPKKDLIIMGIITEKYFINSETNVFFKVKILSLNIPETKIYMKSVKVNEVYDFQLKYLRIKRHD